MPGAHDALYENALVGTRVREALAPRDPPFVPGRGRKLDRASSEPIIQTGEFDPGSERNVCGGPNTCKSNGKG